VDSLRMVADCLTQRREPPTSSGKEGGHQSGKWGDGQKGKVALREIAQWEGIDNSYVSRMVNLTNLAPIIVEAILDDVLPSESTLFDLAVDPPALWDELRARIARSSPT